METSAHEQVDLTDYLKRVTFTFACLAVARTGAHIAAPGIDTSAILFGASDFSKLTRSALESVSIAALGVQPLLTALILARVWTYVIGQAPPGPALASMGVIGLALIFAASQALGIARAMEPIHGHSDLPIVPDAGAGFEFAFVLTLIAGTACLIAVADCISRYGLGGGFWWMLLLPAIDGTFYLPFEAAKHVHDQNIATDSVIKILAWTAASALSLATLWHFAVAPGLEPDSENAKLKPAALGNLRLRPEALFWPILITQTVTGHLASADFAVLSWLEVDQPSQLWFSAGTASRVLLAAVLLYLIVGFETRPQQLTQAQRLAVTLVLTAATAGFEWVQAATGMVVFLNTDFALLILLGLLALQPLRPLFKVWAQAAMR